MTELSVGTLAIGAILGIVFAGVGIYSGTQTGVVEFGNVPAAMLGFVLLDAITRGRRATSREGVIIMTVASSAGCMGLTGGLLGPVVALVMSGQDPPMVAVAAWGIALGALGCLLAIPLRAVFVTRRGLPFPTGTATAEILTAFETGSRGGRARLMVLLAAFAVGAVAVVLRDGLGWIPYVTLIPVTVGALPAAGMYLGIGWSPLLVGIGMLVGQGLALAFVIGGAIAWLAIAPWLVAEGLATADYASLVTWLVWPGVALMVGGTLAGVVGGVARLRAGLRELRGSPGGEWGLSRGHAIAVIAAVAAVAVTGWLAFGIHPAIAVLAVVLAALVCPAAARTTAETDVTPAGPLGSLGQVLGGALSSGGIATPLAGGGIVNGVTMHSSWLLTNWKAGWLTRARPRAQLVAQLVGVVVGGVACVLVFEMILSEYGIPSDAMPAPAAQSWKATADVLQHGISSMPRHAPLASALALAAGVALALGGRRWRWLPSPFALGMAFILPPYMALAIALGAGVGWLIAARRPAWAAEQSAGLAAGLIAGEAVTGLAIIAVQYFA